MRLKQHLECGEARDILNGEYIAALENVENVYLFT